MHGLKLSLYNSLPQEGVGASKAVMNVDIAWGVLRERSRSY